MSLYRVYGRRRGEHRTSYLGAQQADSEADARHLILRSHPGARIERIEHAGAGQGAPPTKETALTRRLKAQGKIQSPESKATRYRIERVSKDRYRVKAQGFYTDDNGVVHPIT